jgi:undecaprenyl-diphosphatase
VLICIATVPAALVGLFGQEALDDYFRGDTHRTRAIATIALLMIGLALLLWAAERSAAHHRKLHHMTWQDAVMIGLAQATALLPGVSRSGSTITTGLFQGLARADAARFSFLLGTPITLAGGTKAIIDALSAGISGSEAISLIAGAATSAVVGYLAIWWLLKLLQRASTAMFIVYRIAFGIVLLFLLATGVN